MKGQNFGKCITPKLWGFPDIAMLEFNKASININAEANL